MAINTLKIMIPKIFFELVLPSILIVWMLINSGNKWGRTKKTIRIPDTTLTKHMPAAFLFFYDALAQTLDYM